MSTLTQTAGSWFHVIELVCEALFGAEDRRLKADIYQLVLDNEEAYGRLLDGFNYLGKFYRKSDNLRGKLQQPLLHESLHDRMEAHLKDAATIASDEQLIRQALFGVLDHAHTEQDVRDTLPECLIGLVSGLGKLHRTREAGCTVLSLPRQTKTFQAALPRIEFYALAHLIY